MSGPAMSMLDPTAWGLAAAKVTVLFALAWGLVLLLRSRSAWVRNRILALALVGGLVLPLLGGLVPAWEVLPVPGGTPRGTATLAGPIEAARSSPVRPEAPSRATPGEGQGGGLPPMAVAREDPPLRPWILTATGLVSAAWALGTAGLLVLLGLRVFSMRRFLATTRSVEDVEWLELVAEGRRRLALRAPVDLRLAGNGVMPFVWGLRRPVLVLPAEALGWEADRRRAVLGHELAHVARRDVPLLLLSRVTCALHWFNPLAWMLRRRMALEAEYACDELALVQGVRPEDYAEHLLVIATSCGSSPRLAPVMAGRNQLEGRIMAILDPRTQGRSARPTGSLMLAGAFVLVLPLASLAWSREGPSERQESRVAVRPVQERQARPGSVSDTADFKERLHELGVDAGDVEGLLGLVGSESAVTRGAAVWALARTKDSRAVEVLLVGLSDGSALVRQWAVRGLGQVGGGRAVEPLIGLLDDVDAENREWVVRMLGQLGDPRAAGALAARTGDPDPDVREWIARSLASFRGAEAFAGLASLLEDPDANVREWAVRSLAAPGQPVPPRLLGERMLDDAPDVRQWAVRVAAGLALEGLQQDLIARIADADAEVREWAVRALGAYGDPGSSSWQPGDAEALMPGLDRTPRRPAGPAVIQALVSALGNPDVTVREWAARSLGDVGDGSAVGPLAASLSDASADVREWALRALGSLRDARAVGPLIGALGSPEAEVREWAVRGLGQLRDARTVGPLVERCRDGDPSVREWAVRALGALGDASAIEALRARLDDVNPDVRRWARVALEQLER